MKSIALLGATGSIGDSALSVVEHFPDRFRIVSMSAGSQIEKLMPAIAAHRPKVVSVNPGLKKLAQHLADKRTRKKSR